MNPSLRKWVICDLILKVLISQMRVRQTCKDNTVSTKDPMMLQTGRREVSEQYAAPRLAALSMLRCRGLYTGTDDEQGGAQARS